jgi:small conductance mechanosensitive channel
MIILYQPFKLGDTITVSGNTGTVAGVNFCYSTLEADGKTIPVPNSTMFSNTVIIQ